MPSPETSAEMNSMTEKVFELMKLASGARARARSGDPEELSETEFLTLDTLTHHEFLCVGDIQKRIGVLPTQMSRIIRSLESKGGEAYVACSINAHDRRKIDVRITSTGTNAHRVYKESRLGFAREVLNALTTEDRKVFMRLMETISKGISGETRQA